MTEELYREDAYRTETGAVVVSCDERGIVLDRTVFYPRGGGQAGDSGLLIRADGSAIPIADTGRGQPPRGQDSEFEGAPILHVPPPPPALPPGETGTARLDREERHRHLRFHT